MNKKNIILGLVVTILALIVLISYFRFNTQQKNGLMPIPVFNSGNSPEPVNSKPINKPVSELTLLNVVPKEDALVQFSPTQQIEIAFNSTVPPEKLHLQITPDTKVIIKAKVSDEKSLLIYPESSWIKGITIITIFEDTQSENGSFLNKKFIYKINTGVPDYSNFIE